MRGKVSIRGKGKKAVERTPRPRPRVYASGLRWPAVQAPRVQLAHVVGEAGAYSPVASKRTGETPGRPQRENAFPATERDARKGENQLLILRFVQLVPTPAK